MLDQILHRIKEIVEYLEHVANQVTKDQKTASHVSLGELDTTNYKQALDHLHKALEFIHKQEVISLQYQEDEQEKERTETPNKISARIF